MTFEKYLEDIFLKLYPMVIKDDAEDAFDNWIEQLDGEEYIKYANLYGQERYLEGKEELVGSIYCDHINDGKNDCTCPKFHYYGDSSEETQDNV